MRRTASIVATTLTMLTCVLPLRLAGAHDLPASAHPATSEAEEVESLLAMQPPGTPSNPKLFSFIATRLTWHQPTLAVCFWNGDQPQRKKIAGIADEVAALTPVRFAWGSAGHMTDCPKIGFQAFPVRVSTKADPSLLAPGDASLDYFASVGQQLLTATRRASVNLPFPSGASTALYREKTLHEFCHVLGCLHEHQRGLCDKDFDAAWIKAHYGYSNEQYKDNFLNIPSSDAYYGPRQFGIFDDKSVMLYSIPVQAFSNKASRCYRASPVSEMSDLDRSGLRSAYNGGDMQLKTLDDFARMTLAFEEEGRLKRAEARALRQTGGAWTQSTSLLASQDRRKAQLAFETFALVAEADAARADAAAASYRLTPEATEAVRRFLARLAPAPIR